MEYVAEISNGGKFLKFLSEKISKNISWRLTVISYSMLKTVLHQCCWEVHCEPTTPLEVKRQCVFFWDFSLSFLGGSFTFMQRGRLPFIYSTWNCIEIFQMCGWMPSAALRNFHSLQILSLPHYFLSSSSRTSIIKYVLVVFSIPSMSITHSFIFSSIVLFLSSDDSFWSFSSVTLA